MIVIPERDSQQIFPALGIFEDFEFIHRKISYFCDSRVVSTISPVIQKQLVETPWNRTFLIPEIRGNFCFVLNKIVNREIPIKQENFLLLYVFAKFLEIQPLIHEACAIMHEIDIHEILEGLNELIKFKCPYEEVIEIIRPKITALYKSSDLYSIPKQCIKQLFQDSLLDLLKSSNEKFSCDDLMELYQASSNQELISNTLQKKYDYDLNQIRDKIIPILINTTSLKEETVLDLSKSSEHQFNGVFSSFIKQDTLYTSVQVISSTVYSKAYRAYNVLNYDDPTSVYCSFEGPFDFIQFYMIISKAKVTAYQIQVGSSGDSVYPISWQFDASNDGIEWFTLDIHRDDHSLKGAYRNQIFHIVDNNEFFQYFRILQRETSSKSNKRFIVSAFEIYGYLEKRNFK